MIKKITYIFLTIISLLLGTGCATSEKPILNAFTKPFSVSTTPPEGPYNYRQGWKDGCETGISSTNTFFQLSVGTHKFTLDENLRTDKLYNRAWSYGFNHCGYAMRSYALYNRE